VTSLLATALLLGVAHSFAPDHLAAIGVFVSRRPQWRRALAIGARWGVGHSMVIVVVGGALVLTGWRFPDRLAPVVEGIVGVTLVAIGIMALVRALRVHGHWHEHDGVAHWHLHSHRTSEEHDHVHQAAFGMGMLHGLAGTGALVVALPLAATESGRVSPWPPSACWPAGRYAAADTGRHGSCARPRRSRRSRASASACGGSPPPDERRTA
jgi:hypothetical protein